MSSNIGNALKISIFGESHGSAIGVVIDGLPSGVTLDLNFIKREMKRRAPGRNETSTPRKEEDDVEIVSGFFNGKTTGTPLCGMIKNEDTRSSAYEKTKYELRPSHADYTGYTKYHGFNDYRGGGHFSGRLTAPLVFAGSIAKQILRDYNIFIGSHVSKILNIEDADFSELSPSIFKYIAGKPLPVLDDLTGKKMENAILEAKNDLDSLGGIVECAIINVPTGIGSPMFDSVESQLSHMLFSIPAVKGVEFGAGFHFAEMKGSEANDEFTLSNGKIKTLTNHNGGILGGISTGMPIIFKVVLKPTPSIAKPQRTVDLVTKKETRISIQGRHDPCIVFRAIPVIECASALVVLDMLLSENSL
ncbi:MAG: chorismate synthase [Peptostreptococcales bacterium]